ncbi:Putative intracellular protease/amidase [Streptomyces sp. DvalAA-14]|uniref:type 1 glutamine amidotransferase domain-containing protein n=1 Tax=unclassified Streptomyces TaxID=2593676 RepID=UPI00081B4383|nr:MULTISPECIES: type 1 glutamine amidotransferase domain-containing protein [unclassified Streptomyces]MYS23756.1 type 1 glutamine amidotransferase domain-containing protein [Streptomyces sp. SID4948]SCE38344.1 Putative intracellular protease/amidase [Streptomyces sp. DvalAA-14]
MASVLMVLTSAKFWSQKDGTQRPTGFWAEEFAVPHRVLTEAGVDLTIATPGGLPAVADELGLSLSANGGDAAKVADLRDYLDSAKDLLAAPVRLEDVDPADYDAVIIPGGHGPMQDLAVNPDIGRILAAMLNDPAKVVASLCHGPASFMAAGQDDGSWLFKGRRLTAFTDAEEKQVGLAANALWLLEERLRGAGALFESGPAWSSYVVVDGNLVTGQNPASGEAAATALLKELAARTAAA